MEKEEEKKKKLEERVNRGNREREKIQRKRD